MTDTQRLVLQGRAIIALLTTLLVIEATGREMNVAELGGGAAAVIYALYAAIGRKGNSNDEPTG